MESNIIMRKNAQNTRLKLTCGTVINAAVKMRQELTNTGYGIEELQRLYLKTSVVDNFVRDNTSKCDTGSAQRKLVKRKGCR